MKIVEVPVRLWLPGSDTPRSEGIHASGIIRSIAARTGFLKPEWVEEDTIKDRKEITDPVAILRIQIGLAWEQFYIRQVLSKEGIEDHPPELFQDGIYMSPDAEEWESIVLASGKKGRRRRIHEIKATYKSTKTVGDMRGQWMWLAQMMGYCYASKTQFASIHVLFICGDYGMPIKPVLKRWNIEFTFKELKENWSLLRDYKNNWEAMEVA